MEWAGKLPADRIAEARGAVLQGWLQVRPDGAANYARKLSAGPERDNAVRIITQQLIYQAPEQAAAWLRTLTDAEQKSAIDIYATGMPSGMKAKLEAAMKKTSN